MNSAATVEAPTSSVITEPVGDIDREVVERASALVPLLAANADRTEARREVVDDNIAALEDAQLFDTIVPARFGGLGCTMATQIAVSAELARGCTSTAWVHTILSITAYGASRSRAGAEIFESAGGRRPRFCGVINPSGVAVPVGGGYRLTGRWPYSSGSFHADWFNGGAMIADGDGNPVEPAMVYMSSDEYSVADTWHVAGLQGTASNTVVADDVFIPERRVMRFAEPPPPADAPGDRWPLASALSLVICAPLLGAAKACADHVVGKVPKRAISYTTYDAATSSPVAISKTAEALLDIDTAWLHAFQAANYIDGVGNGTIEETPVANARLRGQCGYLTERLREGVDTLLTVFGAGSFATASPVQRYWRDVNVGSRHAFLSTNVSYELYGRGLFDLEQIMLLV